MLERREGVLRLASLSLFFGFVFVVSLDVCVRAGRRDDVNIQGRE